MTGGKIMKDEGELGTLKTEGMFPMITSGDLADIVVPLALSQPGVRN